MQKRTSESIWVGEENRGPSQAQKRSDLENRGGGREIRSTEKSIKTKKGKDLKGQELLRKVGTARRAKRDLQGQARAAPGASRPAKRKTNDNRGRALHWRERLGNRWKGAQMQSSNLREKKPGAGVQRGSRREPKKEGRGNLPLSARLAGTRGGKSRLSKRDKIVRSKEAENKTGGGEQEEEGPGGERKVGN